MNLKRIRLELARGPDHPDGDHRIGYEFKAPLATDGRVDLEEWRKRKKDCTVRRFWEGEEEEHGHLAHTRRGAWAFSYRPGDEEDTPFFRFEEHAFLPGEYVSVQEQDGKTYTFKVAWVVDA